MLTPLTHLHPSPPQHPSSSSTSSSSPTTSNRDPAALLMPSQQNVEKEHMFDKVVTPSDVGKLNRLVIPKQHAEKYFPLDAAANEKELLLNFEDRNGKPWRFRYSYWNSSQSYVMTKGWSRFVKEKRLDAGDTVSFGRGVGESGRDRLFIDWKRRPESHHHHNHNLQNPPTIPRFPIQQQHPYNSMMPWSRLYTPSSALGGPSMSGYNPYLYLRSPVSSGPSSSSSSFAGHSNLGVQMQYPSAGNAPSTQMRTVLPIVYDSVPVRQYSENVPPVTNSKRVRLFGVNLDCSSSAAASSSSQVRSPVLSLQLCLGDGATNVADEEDKQTMSLDLDI